MRKNNDFVVCRHSIAELSFYETFNEIFLRKKLRNSVCIYRRCPPEGPDDDVYYEVLKDSFPSPLHCIASAYRANVFFTAMESYSDSLNECNTCFDVVRKMETVFINDNSMMLCSLVPILICNSLSQMYDEHLQVILGFATLHRNISFSESPTSSTAHEVCLKLDSWEFLKYLYIQCEHKLCIKPTKITHLFFSNPGRLQPCMSQLVENAPFSAAILFAALRQSKAYKNPICGNLIPNHVSAV